MSGFRNFSKKYTNFLYKSSHQKCHL